MATIIFGPGVTPRGRRRGVVYQGNASAVAVPGQRLPTPSTVRSMAVPVQPWSAPQVTSQMSLAAAANQWRALTKDAQSVYLPFTTPTAGTPPDGLVITTTGYGTYILIEGLAAQWQIGPGPHGNPPAISFSGAGYCGWQTSPDGLSVILSCVWGEDVPVGMTYSFCVYWAPNVALISPVKEVGAGQPFAPAWTPQYTYLGRFGPCYENVVASFDITGPVLAALGTIPPNLTFNPITRDREGGNLYAQFWILDGFGNPVYCGGTYPGYPPYVLPGWGSMP